MKSLLNELRFTCTKDLSILSAELLNYVTEHPEFNSKHWAFLVELLSKIIGLKKAEKKKFRALCNLTGVTLSAAHRKEVAKLAATKFSHMKGVH